MYKIQNKYQDGGWEDLGFRYLVKSQSLEKALECSCDAICYGMVRIINEDTDEVVVTYAAGEGNR